MAGATALLCATTSARAGTATEEIVVLYDDGTVSADTLDAVVRDATPAHARGKSLTRSIRGGGSSRLSAVTFDVPSGLSEEAALAAVRRTSGVRYASRNRRWQTRGAPRDVPVQGGELGLLDVMEQPAIDQIGAAGKGGDGVTVAVLDGGFDTRHEMIVGSLVTGAFDALDLDTDPLDLGDGVDGDGDGIADDMVGHGTFVAGLVLAVAPDAGILPIRVLDDEGWGTDLGLLLGVNHAVDQDADVVNMSLVLPQMPVGLATLLDAARSDGVVFVTSAGNDASGPFDDAGFRARAITVGGVDSDDVVLSWSPTSPVTEVYAPAEDLLGPLGGATEDSYATWSGTSFASALVSGAAALLRQADSTLTVQEIEAAVQSQTTGVSGDSNAGLLNVQSALDWVQ